MVGGNRTDFRNHQVRANLVAQPLNCENCFDRMLTGHEVLRLQLFTSAGGEAHAKVRHPFIPRARHAHLFRTVLSRKFNNGVQVPGSTFGPEEFRGYVKRLPLFDAALDPNFVDTLVLPVGKETDAVPAGLDSIKVVFHCSERHVLVDVLAHHESWLNIEINLCDYAQRTKTNKGSEKRLAVLLAGELNDLAVRRDNFKR